MTRAADPSRPSRRPARARGFTLLETALAVVLASLIAASGVGLWLAVSRAERALGRVALQSNELSITQQVMRRSFMTMLLLPPDAQIETPEQQAEGLEAVQEALDQAFSAEPDEVPARPRVILELDRAPSLLRMIEAARFDGVLHADAQDPSATGFAQPQRLEMVLARTPAVEPPGNRLGWANRNDIADAALFRAQGLQPPGEGGVRGCFELRPDGARERVLAGFGLTPRSELPPEARRALDAGREPEGWTLWWRPIGEREYVLRQQGVVVDPDADPRFLEGSIPLAQGLRLCQWEFWHAEDPEEGETRTAEGVDLVSSLARSFYFTDQVIGYATLELEGLGGGYGDWMFEVGWNVDEEPVVEDAAEDDGDGDEDEDAGGDPGDPQPLDPDAGAAA